MNNDWDGHDRRSSNPWIDRLLDEIHELRRIVEINSNRLSRMEARIDANDRFVAKIMLVVSTGIGAVWALFKWVSEHLK